MAAVSVLAIVLSCRRGSEPPAAPPPMTLGPEDVVTVAPCELEAGPSISGTLQPRLAATVRAEVAGPVREVHVERGQSVAEGTLAVVLDDTAERDALLAARSAVRSARNALQVAEQEAVRSRKLAEAGGLAQRDLERAEAAVALQHAQLADAQARLAVAAQQMDRTRVHVPFAGVLSERPVSQGDIVQVGTALFTVVDPSTLRLEAQVPVANLSRLSPGTPVDFFVAGLPDRTFRGQVEYVQPVVDPATGQVRLDVALPNPGGPLLGGLAARGRVVTEVRRGLCAPLDAVDFATAQPVVLRVRPDQVIERMPVQLGLRDELSQTVEVVSGAQAAQVLVRGSARESVAPGTRVQLPPPRPSEQNQARTPPRRP
ncbi:MAG: efflux RND transporter periplasmic adaptor subunit [Myxococcales bacterium]